MGFVKRFVGMALVVAAAASLYGCAGGGGNGSSEFSASQGQNQSMVSKDTDASLPFEAGYEGQGGYIEIEESSGELEELRKFTLCGAEYELPSEMSAFTDNGWTKAEGSRETLPAGYSSVMTLTSDSDILPYLGITNNTDAEAGWHDFTVDSMEVSGKTEDGDISDLFATAKGLSVGDTVRTTIDLYGDPNYIAWNSGGDAVYSMSWDYRSYKESGELNSVGITVTLADDNTIRKIKILVNS